MRATPERSALGLRRAALLAGGALLALALLEGALRLSGAVWRDANRRAARGAGTRTLLCLGDSHTFGVWMDPAGPYPAQLAALIERRAPGAFRVANLGVPGIHSPAVLSRLEEDLRRESPAAVALLVGINNHWAPARMHARGGSFLADLRIVRVANLVRRRLATRPRPPDPGSAGGQSIAAVTRGGETRPYTLFPKPLTPADEAMLAGLRADLLSATATISGAGALPLLLTYGAGGGDFDAVNDAIRAAARASGARLVDAGAAFTSVDPGVDRSRLLLPDFHPDREGYGVVARLALDALVAEGLVPGPRVEDPFESMRDRPRPAPRLRSVEGEGGAIALETEFLPDFDCRIFFARAAGSGASAWGKPLPLVKDEVFERTCRLEALFAPFDARGAARFEIGEPVRVALGTGEFFAVATALRWPFVPGVPTSELAKRPEAPFGFGWLVAHSEPVRIALR